MNNAEANESQDNQSDRAAKSPIKTPSTETAHVSMSDARKAEAGREAHAGAGAGDDLSARGDARSARHPRGIDVINDETLDDTVDTDGKNVHAKREAEMRAHDPDAVISSNATLVNFVPEPGDGLGGFDSRPARNGLALALERGYRMIDRGMVAPAVPEVEAQLRFEARDARGHTLRGRKHYAMNHLRPSRLIEIERS
ncbi:DUF3005 domain-containing protein [Caballeronia sp. ATUFL_M2_KS44]|uniref:DUF3005 domain-containing protein n=1 Tax=Caballeronia sp. ATUFL_M2_KS44 TaxID=2921767 RepID=UPI0020293B6A|nr:DUF3005 domain-containing protein [Caballeronia sp. ATUFL_M2_KS44]